MTKKLLIYLFLGFFVPNLLAQEYKKIAVWQKNKSLITRLLMSDDEKFLVAGDRNGDVYIWEIKYANFIKKLDISPNFKITDLSFSPDNKLLAVASYNGFVHIFDTEHFELKQKIALPKGDKLEGIEGVEATFARFNQENVLHFGGFNRKLSYFHNKNNLIIDFFKFDGNLINCATFSPMQKTFVAGVGAELFFFDADNKKFLFKLGTYKNYEDIVCEVQYLSEDELLYWKLNGELFLANLKNKTVEPFLDVADVMGTSQFVLTDSLILSGNNGLAVVIWDKQTKQKRQVLNNHSVVCGYMAAAKQANFIVTSDSAKLYVWSNLPNGFFVKEKMTPKEDSMLIIKDMPKPKVATSITLELLFEQAKANLKPESLPYMEKLLHYLNFYPTIEILLAGHTDNFGSKAHNLQLSLMRAQTVYNYLVEKGIKKERITLKAYGGTKPLVDNRNAKLRHLNRRVEMIILKE